MSRILRLFVAVLVGASVLVLVPSTALAANPATDDAEVFCEVVPEFSTGVEAGVSSVAPGENVVVQNRVVFGAGDVFQDIVVQPDGSVFFASWLQLDLGASSIEYSPLTPTLTFNGALVTYQDGTEPAPGVYVFNAARNRMYLPGDPAVFGNGVGEVSISTVAGDELVVSYSGVVTSDVSGTSEQVAACSFSLASGDSNRTESATETFVGVSDLEVNTTKSVEPSVVVAGQTVTYTIEVANPLLTSGGVQAGPAFNVAVNDSYDPALLSDPVVTSGSGVTVDAATPGQAVFTVGRIDAGETVTITYTQVVSAAAGAGTQVGNTATSSATSAPDAGGPYTVPFVGAGVTEDVAVASDAPELTKTASASEAGENVVVDFSVEVVIPENSTYYDAVFYDIIPKGFQDFVATGGTITQTCGAATCPTSTVLGPETDPLTGEQRFGLYYETITTTTPLTITYTYSLTTGTIAANDLVVGEVLTNAAAFGFYAVPTLGGIEPNLAELPTFDGSVLDSEDVTFRRPVLEIEKTFLGDTPATEAQMRDGLPYSVTVTNTGNADATNVSVGDFNDAGFEIVPASVVGAVYDDFGRFTVPLVPAEDSVTVTYTTAFSGGYTKSEFENTVRVSRYFGEDTEAYTPTDIADTASAELQYPLLEIEKSTPLSVYSTAQGTVVPFEFKLTNVSNVSAVNPRMVDAPNLTGGTFTAQNLVCDGALPWTLSSTATDFTMASTGSIAPGVSVTCTVEMVLAADADPDTYTNTVDATWLDVFGKNRYRDPNFNITFYTASAEAPYTLVDPALSIQKFPNADSDISIMQDRVAVYRVVIVNTGPVDTANVLFTDTLPAGLNFVTGNDPQVTVQDGPSGDTSAAVTNFTGADLDVSFDNVAPGARITILIPVQNDGTGSIGDQYDNIGTVDFDTNDAPLSDDGTLFFIPVIDPVTVTKTVDPTTASVGQVVEYTVIMDIPMNGLDLYDVTFRDTLPDGLEFVAFTSTPAGLTEIAPIVDPIDGETHFGYFADDITANTAPLSYTATYTARVLEELSTGSPVQAAPLTNVIQPLFNVGASQFDPLNLPAIDQGPAGQFNVRGERAEADLGITMPVIAVEKVLTSHTGPDVWSNTTGASGEGYFVDVEDALEYQVTITNTGNAPALVVDFVDDMANGDLTDITYSITLPAGTSSSTVTNDIDSPTDADGIAIQFDVIEPGESVVITYTSTATDSPVLVPGLGGANYDVGLITNIADVTRFESAGATEFTVVNDAQVSAYVITPIVRVEIEQQCFEPTAAGQFGTGVIYLYNNVQLPFSTPLTVPGWPLLDGAGALHDGVIEVTISSDLIFNEVTVTNVYSLRDVTTDEIVPVVSFTTVDNGDGTQTVSLDLPVLEQSDRLFIEYSIISTVAGSYGAKALAYGNDAAGNGLRGDDAAADFFYRDTDGAGCLPPQPQVPRLTKLPDLKNLYPEDEITWHGTLYADRDRSNVDYSLVLTDVVLTDRLPDYVTFTPGTAEFVVTDGSGTANTFTVAGGDVTETVTALADGRTEIVFTSPAFAEIHLINWRFDSVVDADAPIQVPILVLTNYIDATYSNDVPSPNICDGDASAVERVCDTGSIAVHDTSIPLITKTVDDESVQAGDTLTYSIDVTIPSNQLEIFDATIMDSWTHLDLTLMLSDGLIGTLTCTSGCLDIDPDPIAYPFTGISDSTAAWFVGDLLPNANDRVYQWTITIPTASVESTYWDANGSAVITNDAVVLYNIVDKEPVAPPDNTFSRTYVGDVTQTASESSQVYNHPPGAITKKCAAPGNEPGRYNREAPLVFHSDVGVSNWQCVLTFDFAAGFGALGDVFSYDGFTMTEIFPTQASRRSARADLDVQVISIEADDSPNWTFTDVPAVNVNNPAPVFPVLDGLDGVYSGQFSTGDVIQVVLNLRVTAYETGTSNIHEIPNGRPRFSFSNRAVLDTIVDPFVGSHTIDTDDSFISALQSPTARIHKRVWRSSRFDSPNSIEVMEGLLEGGVCFDEINPLCDTLTVGEPGSLANIFGSLVDVVPGERLTYSINVKASGASGLQVEDFLPPGYDYIPGSARLFTTSLDEAPFYDGNYVPLTDPAILGQSGDPDCSTALSTMFHFSSGFTRTHSPWHERGGQTLTWTFTDTGDATDPTAANWYPELSSGSQVGVFTIMFDVDTSDATACEGTASGTNLYKNGVELTPTWPLNAISTPLTDAAYTSHLAADTLTKLPTDGYSVDGATASFTIRLEVNDRMLWRSAGGGFSNELVNQSAGLCPGYSHPTAAPALLPYQELIDCGYHDDANAGGARTLETLTYDDLARVRGNATQTLAPGFGNPVGSGQKRIDVPARTVTDTFIDDGLYVDGSAVVTGLNAWGDPVAATNITSEQVVRGVDAATGRENVTITWTLSEVPMPVTVAHPVGNGHDLFVYSSAVEIMVPLDIPEDTIDGYQYFNEATSSLETSVCLGTVVASGTLCSELSDSGTNTMTTPISEAMITVVNPAPPVVSKSAEPGLVAPGEEFVWNLNLELGARQAWFDLAFTDSISKEFFEVIDVGDPVCTNTATGDRCDQNIAVVDLTVTDTATSTDIAAFFDDVAGAGVDRTLTIPVRVRNSSGEVAGAVLENEMQGFSNEENLIDRLTEAPTGFFTDETVGEVTVIEPNLVVDKQVVNIGDGPFSAGDTLDWELTITNTGDAPAYSVRFEDRPDPRTIGPASAAVVPELTKNYTSARPWMAWRFAVIAPGESVTVTVSGTVLAGYEDLGLITADNDAVVTDYYSGLPLDPDVRQYDPVADVAQAPLIAPNVTIAKYSGDCVSPGTTFDAGDSVAWCLVLTNNGQADSVNAVVSDALPVGWQLDTAVEPTLTLADGATTVPLTSYMTTAALASGGQLITFDLNTAGQTQYGTIGSGESIQITYNTLSANRTTVLNRASVLTSLASGDPVDGTPPGYFSTASAPAAPLGQGLEIIKTVRGNPADANLFAQECDYLLGCSVTWDVVTINTDQARLTQVSVVDYVPAGMTITSTTEPAGWTPVIGAAGAGPDGTTVITWTLAGNFDANGSAAFVIETSIAASPDDRSFLNTAVADSAETVEVEDQALATTTTVAPGSVGDYVWLDDDLDGVQDPSESGVEGVVVNLIDENGDVIATTTTDETGYYLFPTVAPGTYTVEFIAPPGLSPVPNGLGGDTDLDSDRLASGSTAPFTVGEGEQIRDIDSGWYVINPAIGIVKHVNGVDANTAPGVEVTTGDTVTFTYDITNTGDVGLVNVSLTDDIEGDIACPQASLSVGETMTCTVTAVAITGQYTNIGTVTADSDVVEGFDSSTVTADASANYLGSTTSTPSTSTPRGPTPPESTQPESTQPESTQPVSTPSGPLSLTGANSGFLVLLGGLLVAGGAILVVVSRRRSRHETVQV